MEELTTKEIQKVCLEILENFHDFAKKHEINYFIAGGTLLGAVRHRGFIPWDDDVDIMIPRPDYERLIRSYSAPHYELSCCEFNSEYTTPFARIWDKRTIIQYPEVNNIDYGVFIDLFPIDGYPSNEMINTLHVWILKWKRLKINISSKNYFQNNERYKTAKKVIKLFLHKTPNQYCKEMNSFAKKYPFDGSKYVGVTTTTVHIFSERNRTEVLGEPLYIPFEHLMLPAPSQWDIYLKHLYGSYMDLPPKDKQTSEHEFKSFRRE